MLGNNWILTAAHCVLIFEKINFKFFFRLENPSQDGQKTVHPNRLTVYLGFVGFYEGGYYFKIDYFAILEVLITLYTCKVEKIISHEYYYELPYMFVFFLIFTSFQDE